MCICGYTGKARSSTNTPCSAKLRLPSEVIRNKLLIMVKMLMKTSLIRFRVTEDERTRIETLAEQSSAASLSDYVRASALNKKIKSHFDQDIAIELLKMNADLSRLGNLFRLSLKESTKYNVEQIALIQRLLTETCGTIKAKVMTL